MVWTKKYPQLRIIKKLSTVDNPFCIFRSGGNYVRRTTSGLPQSDREYSRFAVIAEIAPINRNASLLYDAASKSACVRALSGRPALARGAGARDIFSKCRALRRFYDETINFRISPSKRYVLTRGKAHAHALRVRIFFALSDCLRGYIRAVVSREWFFVSSNESESYEGIRECPYRPYPFCCCSLRPVLRPP